MNQEFSRLERQMQFVLEADRLKQVFRQTLLMDGSRQENDAEHSWHLALMALLLQEHADAAELDLPKVVAMLVIHDIVEIDAGDTFAYDPQANTDKAEREQAAAERLFGLLPEDQGQWFRELWDEFEQRETGEARFAAALDRLQPLFHNYRTQGAAWRRHGVTCEQVIERNRHIAEGSRTLWELAERWIEESVRRGYLPPRQSEDSPANQ